MNWCTTCGAQYEGPEHVCGYVTITKDRLRKLERDLAQAEAAVEWGPPKPPSQAALDIAAKREIGSLRERVERAEEVARAIGNQMARDAHVLGLGVTYEGHALDPTKVTLRYSAGHAPAPRSETADGE